MNNENKRLIKYLGILYIMVIVTYKLPHDSFSIVQYIIRPIKLGNGYLYLSWIIPLALFILGIKGLLNLERFANKSRIMIFLLVVIIIVPFMEWSLDFTRTNYYWIKKDGLNAVDIKDANIYLCNFDDNIQINVNLELIDYSRSHNEFKIRVYLPKTLSKKFDMEYIDLKNNYFTSGNRKNTLKVREIIDVPLNNVKVQDNIDDSKWYWEERKYELYNEDETVKIIDHVIE